MSIPHIPAIVAPRSGAFIFDREDTSLASLSSTDNFPCLAKIVGEGVFFSRSDLRFLHHFIEGPLVWPLLKRRYSAEARHPGHWHCDMTAESLVEVSVCPKDDGRSHEDVERDLVSPNWLCRLKQFVNECMEKDAKMFRFPRTSYVHLLLVENIAQPRG